MPEGDTIFRTAVSIRKWIGGRTISAARTRVSGILIEQVVGCSVDRVEAAGKHLLMEFGKPDQGPLLLRTHMMMSGSWHVYQAGAKWQRPERQARLVLEADDRIVVCFNAPVIELTTESADLSRGVSHLGPDILDPLFSAQQGVARIRSEALSRAIGEILLDQRLVAGIGNIYRCESMFLEGIHPWTTQGSCSTKQLESLVARAQQLMLANLSTDSVSRNFSGEPGKPWVYRRPNRPCRTCGTAIRSRQQGTQARTAYWCPVCQPAPGNYAGHS